MPEIMVKRRFISKNRKVKDRYIMKSLVKPDRNVMRSLIRMRFRYDQKTRKWIASYDHSIK